jgi:hypothetical protein
LKFTPTEFLNYEISVQVFSNLFEYKFALD